MLSKRRLVQLLVTNYSVVNAINIVMWLRSDLSLSPGHRLALANVLLWTPNVFAGHTKMKKISWFLLTTSCHQVIKGYYKKWCRSLSPQGWGVLLAGMPAYCRDTLAALYITSSIRKFHTNSSTALLPTLQPPEHLGRNAIYTFLDTLGGVHKCNFTWCLDFKHCETHFNSSQIKVKANKYFTYGTHTVFWGFWRCRTERKGKCMQSRCHMTQTLKVSLPTAQWKADLFHMHCQDFCCTEHPFVLEQQPWEVSWMGTKLCLCLLPVIHGLNWREGCEDILQSHIFHKYFISKLCCFLEMLVTPVMAIHCHLPSG